MAIWDTHGVSYRIDRFLPGYDFTEHHHVDLTGTVEQAYAGAREMDFSSSRITHILFRVRRLHFEDLTLDGLIASGFVLLDEHPPHEFVLGLSSKGFRPSGAQTREAFEEFVPERGLKIAWNFRTEEREEGVVRLHTETRTKCYGSIKPMFRLYWTVVKPFSGLIRKEMLTAAAAGQRLDTVGRPRAS